MNLCLGLSSFIFSLPLLEVVLSSVLLLLLELVGSCLFGLLLLDSFDQNFLVLEHVSLGEHVELVIKGFVNFSLLSELSEQSSECSLSSHPDHLAGHPGITGTLPLTNTAVSAFPLL